MRHLADVAALKGNPPAQRQLLVDGMNRIVGTNQAFFFGGDGWRPNGRPRFVHQTLGRDNDPVFLKYMAEFGVRYPLTADPFCTRSTRDQADLQVWTFDDVLPDRATERRYEAFMEIRRGGRVKDGVVGVYRQRHTDRICGLGMHQFGNAGRVSARQRALVRFAVTEMQGLIERGHLSIPTLGVDDTILALPPRLQQVLDHFLAGRTPKSIARNLGLSVWTVREHIQRLYRHFKVSGRDELMARFVNGSPDGPAASK
jgi:DNA-binding CsgD family transcriptional regulator